MEPGLLPLFSVVQKLSEEIAECFFHLAYRVKLYAVFACKSRQVVLGEDDMTETEFLGFSNALFNPADRSHFAAEADLSAHTPSLFYRCIDIR